MLGCHGVAGRRTQAGHWRRAREMGCIVLSAYLSFRATATSVHANKMAATRIRMVMRTDYYQRIRIMTFSEPGVSTREQRRLAGGSGDASLRQRRRFYRAIQESVHLRWNHKGRRGCHSLRSHASARWPISQSRSQALSGPSKSSEPSGSPESSRSASTIAPINADQLTATAYFRERILLLHFNTVRQVRPA